MQVNQEKSKIKENNTKGKNICPVIFSGHNDRAVVALCRYFSSKGRNFHLVARDSKDAIYKTKWVEKVIIQRATSELKIELFLNIADLVQQKNCKPCICPTSEFLNHFFFENQDQLIELGWHWLFPEYSIYNELSDKYKSPEHIERILGLKTPPSQTKESWKAPCVLKPKCNLRNGEILYPKICKNQLDLAEALKDVDADDWFSQTFVEGQSYYLCAYIDARGGWVAFWQENMLQQPNGKSVVLARNCVNPGIDVHKLMCGLHEISYRGPFMMEVIQDKSKVLHFIEINPRFWGPLDLARRACPEILQRFLSDIDDETLAAQSKISNVQHMYAWAYGAKTNPLKIYPSAVGLTHDEIQSLLVSHDVYAHADTESLSCKY